MAISDPYHDGELAVQSRAGEASIAQRNAGAISSTIVGGALPFLQRQSMVVLSSRDNDGRMWASIVFGQPGFLSSENGTRLGVDLALALVDPLDPVWPNIEAERRVGALVIELSSRRRIRINGRARLEGPDRLTVEVEESYPACPKYITRRQLRLVNGQAVGDPILTEPGLDELASAVSDADAIFVASQSPKRGFDVSHRGGAPGFVKHRGAHEIQWPEFPGNSMFNTLGNLLHDPRAGVVLPDFRRRRIFQLSGVAQALWDQPDLGNETGGTGRFLQFRFDKWREAALPAAVTEELLDHSPFNPPVVSA